MTEVLPLEAELENFIRRHWRQSDEVADLRQEVLTRLYRFALENRPTQPRALMFRIARNLMIDRIRKKSVVTIDAVMDFESLSVSTDEADPFETTSARQELRMLQDALDDLPQRTRDVIFMRRVQGCSQRETAKKLKISEPTVERHISKGVTLLMEYFRRHGVVRSAGKTRKSEARRDDFA
ncbi:RNA polymerase sigma factor [Ponticaulis profundi]|uniref:RNA polymerase sigma factor n=1 Tax=Ponticaulis profundi TaxID=2665222 RepID=A0ABW1S9T8_9PROT